MINLHVFGVSAPATLYNILGERALLNQANLFRFVECANINFRRFLTIVRELCQDNFYVIRFAYRVDRPMLHLVVYSVYVRCCVSTHKFLRCNQQELGIGDLFSKISQNSRNPLKLNLPMSDKSYPDQGLKRF